MAEKPHLSNNRPAKSSFSLSASIVFLFLCGYSIISSAQVSLLKPVLQYFELGYNFEAILEGDQFLVTRVHELDSVYYTCNAKNFNISSNYKSFYLTGEPKVIAETGSNLAGDNRNELLVGIGCFHGVYNALHKSGKPRVKGFYHNGRPDSLRKEWNEKGNLISAYNYTDGKKHGSFEEFFSNGSRKEIGYYHCNSRMFNKKMWWPNGSLREYKWESPKRRIARYTEKGVLERLYVQDSIDFYLSYDGSTQTKSFDEKEGNWLLKRNWPGGIKKFEERFEAFNGASLGKRLYYDVQGVLTRSETFEVRSSEEELEIEVDEEIEEPDFVRAFYSNDLRPAMGYKSLERQINFSLKDIKIKRKYRGSKILVIERNYSQTQFSFKGKKSWIESQIAENIIKSMEAETWHPMIKNNQAASKVILHLEIDIVKK